MRPAEIEQRIRAHGDLSVLEREYHHRAWREDAFGRTRGRTGMRDCHVEQLAAEGVGDITIDADGDEMVAIPPLR